ncbi:thioesterase family protein [Dendrosporobacter sp. 1207_IL3150]|uniref:thioesterase family protein n=1 Tax=Dendrosporobacter sp. 1207_IL3150 TaxID=3084054 RepID=UPI002FDB7E56
MDYNLVLGMKAEKNEKVTERNTAISYGSGGVAVYATPAMIGLMEGTSLAAVDPHLPEGMATVGTSISVNHIAATPIGIEVRALAELTEIDGKKLTFRIEAYDEKEKIGEGTHQRYIIELEKFLARTQSKK